MTDEKILNLSEIDNDDFEAIKGAVEEWKACGLPGRFTFISDEQSDKTLELLKDIVQEAYNNGVWRGGLALAGGILTGTAIHFGIEYFKAKRKVVE